MTKQDKNLNLNKSKTHLKGLLEAQWSVRVTWVHLWLPHSTLNVHFIKADQNAIFMPNFLSSLWPLKLLLRTINSDLDIRSQCLEGEEETATKLEKTRQLVTEMTTKIRFDIKLP